LIIIIFYFQTFFESTTKCNIEDDDKQLNISNKMKKKSQQQPSRLERSRLGLITFLNNITAAPTNFDLDNTSEELFRFIYIYI
jgi:hypothetical protein